MKIHDIETGELIAELLKRVNHVTYRVHRTHLDALSFRIGVEQQDADVTRKGHNNQPTKGFSL